MFILCLFCLGGFDDESDVADAVDAGFAHAVNEVEGVCSWLGETSLFSVWLFE